MPLRPLAPGVVEIWYTLSDQVSCWQRADSYLSILSAAERQRHDAFRFARDRHTFRVAHALLRQTLSFYQDTAPQAWCFETGPHGRPEIAAPNDTRLRFNLAHTAGLVACAMTIGGDIGIDVEAVDRDLSIEPLAKLVLSESEREELSRHADAEQHDRFIEYWTLKEAYIKATGLGLSTPLHSVSFSTRADGAPCIAFADDIDDRPERWSFWQTRPSDRHHLAVVVAADGQPVQMRPFDCIPW